MKRGEEKKKKEKAENNSIKQFIFNLKINYSKKQRGIVMHFHALSDDGEQIVSQIGGQICRQ